MTHTKVGLHQKEETTPPVLRLLDLFESANEILMTEPVHCPFCGKRLLLTDIEPMYLERRSDDGSTNAWHRVLHRGCTLSRGTSLAYRSGTKKNGWIDIRDDQSTSSWPPKVPGVSSKEARKLEESLTFAEEATRQLGKTVVVPVLFEGGNYCFGAIWRNDEGLVEAQSPLGKGEPIANAGVHRDALSASEHLERTWKKANPEKELWYLTPATTANASEAG